MVNKEKHQGRVVRKPVNVKPELNANWSTIFLVSFAAVVRVVTQRFSPTKRCVTTLITAAKETTIFLV